MKYYYQSYFYPEKEITEEQYHRIKDSIIKCCVTGNPEEIIKKRLRIESEEKDNEREF